MENLESFMPLSVGVGAMVARGAISTMHKTFFYSSQYCLIIIYQSSYYYTAHEIE